MKEQEQEEEIVDRAKTDIDDEELVYRLEREVIELERIKVELKKYYEKRAMVIQELVDLRGIGYHFRDPETGIVFRLAEIRGKWIDFTPIEIQRSRLSTEKFGTISVADVKAMGYELRIPESFEDVVHKIQIPVTDAEDEDEDEDEEMSRLSEKLESKNSAQRELF